MNRAERIETALSVCGGRTDAACACVRDVRAVTHSVQTSSGLRGTKLQVVTTLLRAVAAIVHGLSRRVPRSTVTLVRQHVALLLLPLLPLLRVLLRRLHLCSCTHLQGWGCVVPRQVLLLLLLLLVVHPTAVLRFSEAWKGRLPQWGFSHPANPPTLGSTVFDQSVGVTNGGHGRAPSHAFATTFSPCNQTILDSPRCAQQAQPQTPGSPAGVLPLGNCNSSSERARPLTAH
jgi:hypothetical protein